MKRICNQCSEIIKHDGFVIDDGTEYYCSETCLHERISKEDYEELYIEGLAYWTVFDDEEEEE